MMPLFERLGQAIGTPAENQVLLAIYREMPESNFSSDLLQAVPDHLTMIELAGVIWNDWGKPERITETLGRIGKAPAFPLECLDRPVTPVPGVAKEGGVVSPA
jgi:mannose-1-phosphate guanylyltransferase